MLKKGWNYFLNNDFLKSSSVFYIVNIVNAASNYGLIVIVSHSISDQLSAWTALNSLIIIFLTPVQGLGTNISKRVSSISHQSALAGCEYYSFLRSNTFKVILAFFTLPLVFFLILRSVGLTPDFPSYIFISIITMVALIQSIESQFLMGILDTKHTIQALLSIGLIRLSSTILFIYLGFEIYSLPMGLVASYLVSYLIAKFYGNKYRKKITKEVNKLEENVKKKVQSLSLKEEIYGASKTIIALAFLALTLNLGMVIAERLLNTQEKDLYAVLFNFGQIIHFGSTAFLSAFIAHSARGKNIGIYLQSLALVSLSSLGAGVTFWIFGDLLLQAFNRQEYSSQLYLIILYALLISIYNALFVSVQYLISQDQYRTILKLFIFILLNAVTLIIISSVDLGLQIDIILQYIFANMFFVGGATLYAGYKIFQNR